jgi:hypothetical protein
MKSLVTWTMVTLLSCGLIAGCGIEQKKKADVPVLTIKWRRLVDEEGQTCPRCGATETEVDKAFDHLRESLAIFGIEVRLEKDALDMTAFQQNPTESNSIWVAGKPLEEWLGARVDESVCCGPCGDTECRTIVVDGKTYETIPAGLIERAGLMAASKMAGGAPPSGSVPGGSPSPSSCCGSETSKQNNDSGGCCPE